MSEDLNGLSSAFPLASTTTGLLYGLTKREYIAIHIMSGMKDRDDYTITAERAVKAADALLKALEMKTTEN